MFAPRRLGKSWLMKNLLLKEANGKGWCAIYGDLQNANAYQKAIEILLEEIQKSEDFSEILFNLVKAKFKEILKGEIKTFKEIIIQTDPEKLLDVMDHESSAWDHWDIIVFPGNRRAKQRRFYQDLFDRLNAIH